MDRPSAKRPLSMFTFSRVFVQCFKVRHRVRARYRDVPCKYSSSQYPQGFVSEVIFTLHSVHSSSLSISGEKGAVVTATARLDAMSAKIAQEVEQGQPLLLFTQRLPIISQGWLPAPFVLIKMNV